MRHIKHTDEFIRALQVLLGDSTKKKGHEDFFNSIAIPLSHRLDELRTLTRRPLLFYNDKTFSEINKLQGKLNFLNSLSETKHYSQAADYMDTDLLPQVDDALQSLFGVMREITS